MSNNSPVRKILRSRPNNVKMLTKLFNTGSPERPGVKRKADSQLGPTVPNGQMTMPPNSGVPESRNLAGNNIPKRPTKPPGTTEEDTIGEQQGAKPAREPPDRLKVKPGRPRGLPALAWTGRDQTNKISKYFSLGKPDKSSK